MSRMASYIIGALLLLCSGCSTVPFASNELTPTRQRSAAELSGALWGSGSGSLLVRQSALFELQGMRAPIEGIMKLDLGRKSARLVGMNDMGVKLYDISVEENSSEAHFVIPDLARYPGFTEAVATSVRRIFLAPRPDPLDKLSTQEKSYLFSRESSGRALRFIVGGAQEQLLEKSCEGPGESWRVRYYQYQMQQGNPVPGGIVLDDFSAGYRLTLWIESVEKSDE